MTDISLIWAIACDFSVAWQFFSKRAIVFFLVMDQTPRTILGTFSFWAIFFSRESFPFTFGKSVSSGISSYPVLVGHLGLFVSWPSG
jgi:hypothetical protein